MVVNIIGCGNGQWVLLEPKQRFWLKENCGTVTKRFLYASCSENPSAENERDTKRRRTVKTAAVKKTVKKTEVKRTVKKPEVSLCELHFTMSFRVVMLIALFAIFYDWNWSFFFFLFWFQEPYIARVEQLAKLKQKQDEDKAHVRLHCFRYMHTLVWSCICLSYMFLCWW